MDQETGIGWLCDEFFRGNGAEVRLVCSDFCPNSTYKPTSTLCGGHLGGLVREPVVRQPMLGNESRVKRMLFGVLPNIGVTELVIILAIAIGLVWPVCRICSKAGFPGLLGLLVMVPLLNLVLLFVLASAEWPALRERGPRTGTDG